MTDHTLLAELLAGRPGVWLADVMAFLQSPASPSTDVFLAATTGHTTGLLVNVLWERPLGAAEGPPGAGGGGPGPSGAFARRGTSRPRDLVGGTERA